MIESYFVDTCYRVTTTTNKFGKKVDGAMTPFPCRFRYISSISEGQNKEVITSDALLHAPASANLRRNSVIKYINRFDEPEFYIVERIIEARRGKSTVVEFLKCELRRRYE